MNISGKTVTFFIASQMACNGWWFFFTQDVTRPTILIPIIASIGLLIFMIFWITENW